MKYFTYTILLSGLFLVASCGWSENQKEAARKSIGDGFSQGLESTGATVDPKVKEEWVNCVVDKGAEKMNFDQFSEGGKELETIQEECAQEVGLYEAIVVE